MGAYAIQLTLCWIYGQCCVTDALRAGVRKGGFYESADCCKESSRPEGTDNKARLYQYAQTGTA